MSNSPKNHHVKARFCPSPTGLIHMGNARTALFNVLLAKKLGGDFLLRIEDTDRERSKQEYTDILMRDLQWMDLQWQEGPEQDQGAGPYYQSQRQAIYDDYYHRLEVAGSAYPCFCTEDELALARKVQRASGRPPRYAGTCRRLSEEDIEAKIASGIKPTLRFHVPEDEVVEFDDLVRGPQKFLSKDIGDFIIRRGNGTSPFMFCSALDDVLMGVTHILRGEDHITNTPRQLMILAALGMEAPKYGHIALITGDDNSPLSKRNGSRSIEELRLSGYLPEAIDNYLARLGHYYGHDDLLTLEELAEQFTIKGLAKSPAKFNAQQLNYWQKEAVSRVEFNVLRDWLAQEKSDVVPNAHQDAFFELIRPNIMHPKDLKVWADVVFGELPTLGDKEQAVVTAAGSEYFEAAISAVDQFDKDLKQITTYIGQTAGVKGKALFQPLRVALTSELHGPELAKMLLMMDIEIIKQRLQKHIS